MPIYETYYYPFSPFSYGKIRVTAEVLEDTEKSLKIGLTTYFPGITACGIYNSIPGTWPEFREIQIQNWVKKQYDKCQYTNLHSSQNQNLHTNCFAG